MVPKDEFGTYRGNTTLNSKPSIIAVVDDRQLSREELGFIIEKMCPDLKVIEFTSITDLLPTIDTPESVGLIVASSERLRHIGCACPGDVRRLYPDIPILLRTETNDPVSITRALNAGANGVLTMESDLKLMIEALRFVLAGGTYIPPQVLDAVSSNFGAESDLPNDHSHEAHRVLIGLSNRQRQILRYLAEGCSNKLIGDRLGISEGTVKAHVRRLLIKLNASNRVEAALLAQRLDFKPETPIDRPLRDQSRAIELDTL